MSTAPESAATETLPPEAFDELDALLDDLRARHDEAPQWEFCEGFMAALICSRRPIAPDEYLPLLLGGDDPTGAALFAEPAQHARFMALWRQRWDEVVAALDAPNVESLDDPRAYAPEVLDVRGSVASLPEDERAELAGEELPAFGQVWALGFMFAVENWPDDWAPPREREAAEWLDASLQAIVAVTEDDTALPTLSMFSEDGPPSVSEARLEAYGAAIWAVYDLRELWRTLGPRVAQVRRETGPGRNDACPCGSGKKFKKCCGA